MLQVLGGHPPWGWGGTCSGQSGVISLALLDTVRGQLVSGDLTTHLPQRSSQLDRDVYLRLWEPMEGERNVSQFLIWKKNAQERQTGKKTDFGIRSFGFPPFPMTGTNELLSASVISSRKREPGCHLYPRYWCEDGMSHGVARGSVTRWVGYLGLNCGSAAPSTQSSTK